MLPMLRILTLLTILAPLGLMAAAGSESAGAAEGGAPTFPVPGYVVSPEEESLLERYRRGEGLKNLENELSALSSAAFYGHQAVVAYLLNPESPLSIRPNQESVKGALSSAAFYGHQAVVAYLLNPESPLSVRPNQESVNEALRNAADRGHQALVAYLLNPASPLNVRPNQEEVHGALSSAAYGGHQGLVAYLLNPASPLNVRPNQESVNGALLNAADRGHQALVAYLLNPTSPLSLRPNQEEVHYALSNAVLNGHQAVVAYLLNPESPLSVRPHQWGVNWVLGNAASYGNQAIVAYLLNPESPLSVRPNQEGIFNTYNLMLHRPDRQDVRALLEPHVPAAHRLPAGPAAGADAGGMAGGAAAHHAFVAGQEAIYAEVEAMRGAYEALTTDPRSRDVINNNLPALEETNGEFDRASAALKDQLEHLLAGVHEGTSLHFRLTQALRTLRLLQGDDTIERHPISPLASYRTRSYEGLPNIRQLFVLATRLLGPANPEDFIRSWMAENLIDLSSWNAFRSPFVERFPRIANQSNVGLALGADGESGNGFVTFLANAFWNNAQEVTPAMRGPLMNLKKAYRTHSQERLMPLIEALFMVMRGHNIKLEDPREANGPACADGAYLNLLKVITQTPGIDEVAAHILAGVEIQHCGIPEGGAAGAAGGSGAAATAPPLSGAGGPLAGVDDRMVEEKEASTRSTPNPTADEMLARQLQETESRRVSSEEYLAESEALARRIQAEEYGDQASGHDVSDGTEGRGESRRPHVDPQNPGAAGGGGRRS
jgi:hypothetical protein